MAQELLTALTGAYDRPIDNPYGIGASALAQSMPMLVNPYGSVGSNFAAVAGAGLLSGLLGYFARQDAAETNARIAGLQSQFLNPTATEAQRAAIVAQEPRLSALQNALMAQKLNLQQIKAEEEQKALGKAAGEIAVIEAKKPIEQQTAEAKAINDALNAGQVTYASPTTGEVKEVPNALGVDKTPGKLRTPKEIKAEEDAAFSDVAKLPAVQQLQTASTNLSRIKSLSDIDSATSDIPFITLLISGLDGSVVREGEYARVSGANPLLTRYQKLFESRLNGGSELGVEVKQQLIKEFEGSLTSLQKEALAQAAPRIAIATKRGANPDYLMPVDLSRVYGQPETPPPPPPPDGTGGGDIKSQYNALRLQGKTPQEAASILGIK